MNRKFMIMSALLVGAVAFAAMTALSFAGGESQGKQLALSNSGSSLDASTVSSQATSALAATGVSSNPRLMGVLGKRAFFRVEGDSGQSCFALGSLAPTNIGTVACPQGFPTEDTPILDQSVFSYDASGELNVIAVEGFAADEVAEVAVVDEAGNVHKAKVRGNIYRVSKLPDSRIVSILAFDKSGAAIHTIDFSAK